MNPTPPTEKPTVERIAALHAWYQANVLAQRITPEVERLWFAFFQQGYNGQQLARVIRYLRGQISVGKRNEGCLKLRNLLALDAAGSLTAFDEDLALATGRRNLQVDRKFAPLPEGESAPAAPTRPATGGPAVPVQAGMETEAMRAKRVQQLEELRRNL